MKTVGELIEELQKFPKDTGIVIYNENDEYYYSAERLVEIEVLPSKCYSGEFFNIKHRNYQEVIERTKEIIKVLEIKPKD